MADDVKKLEQQIELIINTNKLSQQVIAELKNVMHKVAADTQGQKNICRRCGYGNASGWMLTSCPNEHVTKNRMCHECREIWLNHPSTHLCTVCMVTVWDYAMKHDMEEGWMTTFELHEYHPLHHPFHHGVHLRMGDLSNPPE